MKENGHTQEQKEKEFFEQGMRMIMWKAWLYEPETLWLYKTPGVDEFSRILALIGFLQSIGNSEMLRARCSHVQQQKREVADSRETFWEQSDLEKIETGLEKLDQHWQWLHKRAVDAEQSLEKAGWRFDTKTRKAKAITDPAAPNRPTELINRAIGLAHDHVCREHDLEGNTEPVRELIRELLVVYFPDEFLDTKDRASIWQAVNNWTRK